MLIAASCGAPDVAAVTPRPSAQPAASPVVLATPTASPIGEVVARIDDAKLREHVRALAAMGSRAPGTEGHRRASEYLVAVLRSYGGPFVGIDTHGAPVATPPNVVALYGAGASERRTPSYIFGAHYDAIADRTPGWQAARDPAPGANDNGTGVAGLLEIARLLAEEDRLGRLSRVVAVVFFDEEETGMRGSAAWVRFAFEGRAEAMVNLDMVGFSAPERKKLDVVRYASSADLLDRARGANDRYGLGLQLVDRLLPADLKTWVDSTPFAMAGAPAITLTESYGQPGIDYPGYPAFHRVTDTPDQINNVAQWRAATQLALAMVLELAR